MKNNVVKDSSVANYSAMDSIKNPELTKVWGSEPDRWGWGERLVPDMQADDSGSRKSTEISFRRYETAARYAKEKRVLDIACGVGYGSQMLRLAGASSVVGVDVSSESIEYAKQRYQTPGIEFLCADAEQFQSSRQFDIVVSFETIEHLNNPIKFLENIHSFLIPGGELILSVPLGETRHFDPYHLHVFSQKQVFALLEKTGFSIDLYRYEEFSLTRSEMDNASKLYPGSNPSTKELFLSFRGWRVIYDYLIRGGIYMPQLLVVARSI